MTWHWVPDRNPDDRSAISTTFPTQGEAETWLGEFIPTWSTRAYARSAFTRLTGWFTGR